MDAKNIFYEFFPNERIFYSKKKRLIVLLGSFADFDSFEYSQQLCAQSKKLEQHSIDLVLIGIGSEESKELFCRFNQIDSQNVFSIRNADLHEKLKLNKGFISPLPSIVNLLIMCAGINSRGTIKEVLRGYWGDIDSNRIFSSDEIIKIGAISLFKGKMFDVLSNQDGLRPFELATRRLMNMIEILYNWNIYVPDASFLTQRGATIIINEKDQVIYKFISESLLGYSSTMSKPLSFLDDLLS